MYAESTGASLEADIWWTVMFYGLSCWKKQQKWT